MGIRLWVGSGHGENDQPIYVLWFSTHYCVDSHYGLVFGKGWLRERCWEWEGGRIFPVCLRAESLAPAEELLVMAVYVSWARQNTEAPILSCFLLCNPKCILLPH